MSEQLIGRRDEPKAQQSDAEAHFTRTDPGQSNPSDCRHSFFSIGRSKYKCCHCKTVVDWEEDYGDHGN